MARLSGCFMKQHPDSCVREGSVNLDEGFCNDTRVELQPLQSRGSKGRRTKTTNQ